MSLGDYPDGALRRAHEDALSQPRPCNAACRPGSHSSTCDQGPDCMVCEDAGFTEAGRGELRILGCPERGCVAGERWRNEEPDLS